MAKMAHIEEIDTNLKGLTSMLFALAEHAENVKIDGDCLFLLANIAWNTQKLSEEELNEATSEAKKEYEAAKAKSGERI